MKNEKWFRALLVATVFIILSITYSCKKEEPVCWTCTTYKYILLVNDIQKTIYDTFPRCDMTETDIDIFESQSNIIDRRTGEGQSIECERQ